jgi:hypothetical protein
VNSHKNARLGSRGEWSSLIAWLLMSGLRRRLPPRLASAFAPCGNGCGAGGKKNGRSG